LLAALDALKIKRTADDVVTDTRKIWHTTTTDEHNGVLLEVVTFAADIGPDFLAVGQADTRDLAESGVRLFRGLGSDLDADTALERSRLVIIPSLKGVDDRAEGWRLRLVGSLFARLAN